LAALVSFGCLINWYRFSFTSRDRGKCPARQIDILTPKMDMLAHEMDILASKMYISPKMYILSSKIDILAPKCTY